MRNYKPDILCESFMDLIGGSSANGLMSTASGLVQSGFNQLFAKRNARIQRDMQADLMHLQDRINDENLKNEREYNDPSAVASRARSAGIAPSALMGGSPGGPGVSSTNRIGSGSVSAPVSNSHWPGLMTGDTIAGLRNAETNATESGARIDNLEAQTEKLNNDIAWDRQRRPLEKESMVLQNAFDRIRNYVEDALAEVNIELAWENLAKASQERSTLRAQEQQYNWVSKQIAATVEKIIPKQVELYSQDIAKAKQDVRKLTADADFRVQEWHDRVNAVLAQTKKFMNGEISNEEFARSINPYLYNIVKNEKGLKLDDELANFYSSSATELKNRGLLEEFNAKYKEIVLKRLEEDGTTYLTWEDRLIAWLDAYANVVGAAMGGSGREAAKVLMK